MWNPSDAVQDDIDLQAEWMEQQFEDYEPSCYDGTYSED